MKKVTIIIPNYNGLKFMEPCFQALKRQTSDEFDVLVETLRNRMKQYERRICL